ncbi:DUF4157 domain-containing protein [Pseudonocardia broussonetiae]|uniref:DUF4157 domain-containing protein n=1 Tax=Pseudonocardia broussonetiae TaxID=2736640 RepID=A0A6M6JM04_9PSEU|nr:DUF4157 domain-containing protein [Pseudonocardia broussonetiae]QJY47957.1 DUF4157 domain-containing protein [Pseudonocardia broussonetiae]
MSAPTAERQAPAPVRRRPGRGAARQAAVELLDSPGQSLDPCVRADVEQLLPGAGVDRLGLVRIHTDDTAADAAEAVGAAAFVLGRHVYFARGRYSPATPAGQRLLLHELTHVLQQETGDRADPAVAVCRETEADLLASPVGEGRAAVPRQEPVTLPALHFRDAVPVPVRASVPVVDLLMRLVARTLRTDPDDRAGRVEAQLARLDTGLRTAIADRAASVLSPLESGRLEAVLERLHPAGATLSTPAAPSTGSTGDEAAPAEPAAGELADGDAADPRTPDADTATPDPTTAAPDTTPTVARAAPTAVEAPDRSTAQRGPADDRTAASGAAPGTGGAGPATQAPAGAATGDPATAVVSPDGGRPAPVPPIAGGPPPIPEPPAVAPDQGPEAPRITDPDAARAAVAAGGPPPPAQAAAPTPDEGERRAEADDSTVLDAATSGGPEAAPAGADAGPGESAADQGDAGGGAGPGTAAAESAATASAPAGPEAAPAGGSVDNGAGSGGAGRPASEAAAASPQAAAALPQPAAAEPGAQPEPEAAETAGPESVEPGAGGAPPSDATADAVTAPEPTHADPAPDRAAADETAEIEAEPGEADADQSGVEETGADGSVAEPAAEPGQAGCGPGAAASAPPAPEPDEAAAGCATSGGAPPEKAPAPPPEPDLASMPPDQAMATVAAARPTALAAALPRVGAAASSTVDTQRAANAAAPPELQRPSGAAAGLDVKAPPPAVPDSAPAAPGKVDRVASNAGPPPAPPVPAPVPDPAARSATAGVPQPRLPGDAKLSEADLAKVSDTVAAMPVRDPELDVTVDTATTVELTGQADPAQVAGQKAALDKQATRAAAQGAKDAAGPLGEADIRPHVPEQTLRAAPPAEGATCPGMPKRGAPAGGAEGRSDTAVDAIAAEQSGERIRAATGKAGSDFAACRTEHDERAATERTDARAGIDQQVLASGTEQVGLRADAVTDSIALRNDWTAEQRTAVTTADTTATAAVGTADKDVTRRRRAGEVTAVGHVQAGNKDITAARTDAEKKARAEREKAKKEESGGGLLGWIGSKISAFLDGIKAAISAAFDLARRAVRAAIDKAKKLATAAIELARKAVVAAIVLAGEVIVAVGDGLLAAFPETRRKFRKLVRDRVEKAVTAVNKAADALQAAVQKALDALASALDCALQYLEAGYLAVVDAVGAVVKGAIDAARAFIEQLAEWADIITDVAADPVGWLKKMGTAAYDGVRNCLWAALKRAVKEWFHSKVEEVVGVGRAIIDVLIRGCLSFADIARMVWEGIKAAIPGILIQLIVEKLVALIVPAGAALSLIIDGLRAAWGAASRILAAFRKFMAFLKAVKTGQAAGDFAALVAAAAVAVLDFLSNFLVGRLKGAATGVGAGLKAMAGRIGRGLAKAGRGVAGGVRRVAGAVGRGVGRTASALNPRRLAGAVARSSIRQAGSARRRGAEAWKKVKDWRERRRQRALERKREKQRRKEERRRKAPEETRRRIEELLARGVGRVRLAVELFRLKRKYGWRVLKAVPGSGPLEFDVDGAMSPGTKLTSGSYQVKIVQTRRTERLAVTPRGEKAAADFQKYEQAVRRGYLTKLTDKLLSPRAVEFVVGSKKRSTLDTVRVQQQRGLKKGRIGGSTQPLVPDAIAEVYDESPSRKGAQPTEVHAFEITLDADWTCVGKGKGLATHKEKQSFETIYTLATRYPNAKIVYFIICPRPPSDHAKQYLENQVLGPPPRGAGLGSRVTVRWHIVGTTGGGRES